MLKQSRKVLYKNQAIYHLISVFMDAVVLLASSGDDLQLALGWFAAEFEAMRMKMISSEPGWSAHSG